MKDIKFWVEDPCILLRDLNIFPTFDMTRNEKLNSLTRLSIIITIVMYLMDYKQWFTFLLLALLIIILLKYLNHSSEHNINEDSGVVEHFTTVPKYSGTEFNQTIVSPLFSEEWRTPPPTYDIYTEVAPVDSPTCYEEPLLPQSYPYGQYLTHTNLIPSDAYQTHLGTGGHIDAREYANSAFMRHTLAHRENMTRLWKKKLARQFKHNTTNSFSPYYSF